MGLFGIWRSIGCNPVGANLLCASRETFGYFLDVVILDVMIKGMI
jgi:hypothetical protein